MISQKLADHTNIGRIIDCILYKVYTPYVSMRDSIGSATSFFHTSMVLYPEFDDHLCTCKFIHKGLFVSLSKKRQNEKKFVELCCPPN